VPVTPDAPLCSECGSIHDAQRELLQVRELRGNQRVLLKSYGLKLLSAFCELGAYRKGQLVSFELAAIKALDIRWDLETPVHNRTTFSS